MVQHLQQGRPLHIKHGGRESWVDACELDLRGPNTETAVKHLQLHNMSS